ncbi:MAG TPA: TadE family protein [Acidimicrobiales bacterium]|jgi:Flp pilus assembly protein TadG|nr:TadE family protein [Acidimicrobiales bacterium]
MTVWRRLGDERGTSTASFVILFPLFLFMFMGLVQWGLYFHARSQVAAAAQDAARATQGVDGTVEDGRAVASSLLEDATSSGLLDDVTVDVTRADGIVRAQVDAQVRVLVPLPGFDVHVRGVSQGATEEFQPEPERG